ncbi:hypothetical protein ACFY1J_24070 [Streptomyces sp. NPDC001406]|uniref:hypothetical protein n=1 Tax=Streptomyces sp. NPDC001406 TaxID=3364572 RepID=UPI0036AF1D73
MRVRMLANVGLMETGQEYELPDAQAKDYIRLEYAEAVKPPRAQSAEVTPSGPEGKPGTARRTKATQAPANKTAKKAAPSKPEPAAGPGAGAEESG